MLGVKIESVEMHTGGGPFRIVTSGLPEIRGDSILEKMAFMQSNIDHLRKMLMAEPRGHFDMFGVYLVEADVPGAAVGCIFIHNEGYSIMCGHGIIALGRYLVDYGIVRNPTSPETRVLIQCPCGPVEAFVQYEAGRSGAVRFNSVPAFLYHKDLKVNVPGIGKVTVDISYGGAFYALVPARDVGVDLEKSSAHEMRSVAGAVTETLRKTVTLTHPESPALAFVYGTILTDGNDIFNDLPTSNVCVFADRQVDRSPCGSGVTSRIARMFNRGLLSLGQSRKFKSLTGAVFSAKPVKEVKYGPHDAVVVEVSGKGFYTGTSTFTLEADDEIGKGFLLK